jgi:geranylgeranyl pyrophosphate synthase
MNLSQYIQQRRKIIGEALERYARESYPGRGMAGMLAYATMGGKRLRGIMVMLACEAAGGRPEALRRPPAPWRFVKRHPWSRMT